MITTIANLLTIVIGIGVTVIWIVSLASWDGKKHCDKDCDNCPFPPCDEDKE